MEDQSSSVIFDQHRATSIEKRFEKLEPMREALHLFIRITLSELPVDAHVLCVGVGTGPELVYLALAYPQWTFTAVEPATPMLDICRKRAEENGFAARCAFHEGFLDSLPESKPFDAAISILVSQFILQQEQRHDFFQQIANKLGPEGYLINADLASDMSSSEYSNLLQVWRRMLEYAGVPAEEADNLGKKVSVLPKHELESIITSSGFSSPVLFFQALLIHAWYARLGT